MIDPHVIRKQIFQFRMEEESQYRLLARRISELGERILPEAFDEVLSDFVPEGVHIVIDRLEIDIGVIHPDQIREQLADRIVAALRQSLLAIGTGRQPGIARVQDGPDRQAAILEHFVRHGRLPWWAGSRNVSIREYARGLIASDPAVITRIFGKFIQDPPRLRRLLHHLDTPALLKAWSRIHPESKAVSEPEMAAIIREVTRHLQVQYGSDRAVEMIRFQLLHALFQHGQRPSSVGGRSIGSILSGGGSWLADGQLTGAPMPGMDFRRLISMLPSRGIDQLTKPQAGDRRKDGRKPDLRHALSGGEGTPGGKPTGKPPFDEVFDRELAAFGGFLRRGTMDIQRQAGLSATVVSIFRSLIAERLQELSGMIRDLGKADRVRKRILDTIPSPRLRSFFEAAVPGKKEVMEWVEAVYVETQRKVRPINQTSIRVQRSVDEITLELFTTTDINAISNISFMRFHIRKMALKHHIRYRDLIRAIWRSSSLHRISPDGRLFTILKQLYEESFPSNTSSGDQASYVSASDKLIYKRQPPCVRTPFEAGDEWWQREHILEDSGRETADRLPARYSSDEGGEGQRSRINEKTDQRVPADPEIRSNREADAIHTGGKPGQEQDFHKVVDTTAGKPATAEAGPEGIDRSAGGKPGQEEDFQKVVDSTAGKPEIGRAHV
jgi:hypothetical protein